MENFYDILDIAMQMSAENYTPENDDYVKGGLIYCGKCHSPRQTVIQLDGKAVTVFCDCDCRHSAYLEEQAKLHAHVGEAEKEKQRTLCFQNAGNLVRCRFENDDGKGDRNVMQMLFKYAGNFKEPYQRGLGLLLYGSYGTGKSYGAACIANKVIEYGYSAMFISFSQLFNTLWSAETKNKQAYLNAINDYDLLIIDDFGAERTNDTSSEIITNVLDGRYNSGKPLIITTNLTPEQLKPSDNPKTERIMSRIIGRCMPIRYTGADRRRNALNQNAEFFKTFFNSV